MRYSEDSHYVTSDKTLGHARTNHFAAKKLGKAAFKLGEKCHKILVCFMLPLKRILRAAGSTDGCCCRLCCDC